MLAILRSVAEVERSTGKRCFVKCPRCSLCDRLGQSNPVTGLDAASQFHALDRETDTTLVLLAAPSHTCKLHSVASRTVCRNNSLHDSTNMARTRTAFAKLSGRCRASHSSSLLEQFSRASLSLCNGSPSNNSDAREEDLCRALDTILAHIWESL